MQASDLAEPVYSARSHERSDGKSDTCRWVFVLAIAGNIAPALRMKRIADCLQAAVDSIPFLFARFALLLRCLSSVVTRRILLRAVPP